MDSAYPRKPGRPTSAARVGEKTTLSFRVAPSIKQRLDDARKEDGRNLSEEAERRLEASLEAEDAFDAALALSYGSDNAGLIHLFSHIVRAEAPAGGVWLEDEAAGAAVVRGLYRMLQHLRAPDDGHVIEDHTPEGLVDRLIYDRLGYEAGEHDDSARARWAAEQRCRMGPEIADRLLRVRRAMKVALESLPPREMPQPPPAAKASWDRVVGKINARDETPEGGEPDVE